MTHSRLFYTFKEGNTINVGTVDSSSGRFENQLTTFRYLGGAAAYDACSAMDQKNQVNDFHYCWLNSCNVCASDGKHIF